MASELLKNRALMQRLKEPKIPNVDFGLQSTGFEELILLPEPKPQELLDIQEDVRIQRQEDTMNKARPFLMDESLDFINRNEMAIGGGVISGTDLGTREGFAGIRYNLKSLGGEGNEYIKTFETKGGEKRYLMNFSRGGFNRKFTQPFTPEGLKRVKEERDKVVKEFESKGIIEKSIKKLKNPPNSNKPWRYRQSVKGNQSIYKYFATEAEAKAAQEKVLEGRAKARFVSYKDELPDIKRLLKGGETIKQVSEELDIPLSAIQKELGKIGKKASDFQPMSYTEDSKLRKQFIKDYKKLSRSDLTKKLFPDDPPKTADAKYGSLRQALTDEGLVEPKKRGELSEERRAKVKTPFEAGKQKRDRRTGKLVKLGSKEYENSLTKFKTEIGRLLGIKEIKGPKSSYMPLDLSHRSDIRLLSRLGDQKITPGDLALEFTEANRRGISRYKFGVKTLERKLEPLYAQQKRLFNKVANDGISKNLTNLIEQNNNKIDKLFETTDPVIASKLNPVLMNAETGEPFRITPKGGRTLLDIGKPLEDVELGGLDDFTIKRNYANQIVQVAKEEGLLDITDKEAQKVINKYFEDAGTRAPIKTVKRTIAGQIQEIPRGTQGFVPNVDLLREELIPTEELGQKKLTALQELASRTGAGVDPSLLMKAGFEEFVKPTGKFAGQIARGVGKGALTAADLAISAGKGGTGLALGALLEADPIITGMSEGKDFGQTARDTFVGSAIDAIPGVNLGSLNEDLIKLADTEEQRVAIQNLIDYQKDYDRFTKDLRAFKSYRGLDQISLDELGFTASDLVDMENKLAKRFEDIQTRAPKIYNPDVLSLARELARKEAMKRKENLEGIQGLIFGDRMAKDPNFIENQIQQIMAASTGVQGATDSYADNYRFLPQEQLTSDELDERFDMEGGIMAANGGRIGFADGPIDPKRRTFMKIMAGIASLPMFSKFLGKSEVAKPIVKIAGSSTKMPDWFPDLINKVMFSGTGKRVDADLTVYEPKELPGISIGRYDDGRVFVEGKNEYGKSYEIEYQPPGYELIDEKTGKAVKRPGEFIAQEEVPVNVDPDGNADFDVEVLEDLDQILGSDTRAMEEFATGKKIKDMNSGEFNVGQSEARAEQAADEAAELEVFDEID